MDTISLAHSMWVKLGYFLVSGSDNQKFNSNPQQQRNGDRYTHGELLESLDPKLGEILISMDYCAVTKALFLEDGR